MFLGIYGSGGLGREVYEIAVLYNSVSPCWSQIVFIDDIRPEGDYFGTKSLNFESLMNTKHLFECVIAVGEPMARQALFQKLQTAEIKLTTLIHPTALVSSKARIGNGTIVCEYATLHAGVDLGCNVLIQPFCCLGHDIQVGSHSVLSAFCAPGGGAVLGEQVFVGMQATLKESLVVGDGAIIAMGAAVFQNVPPHATVVGNPARITRGNKEHKVFK